MGYGPWAIGRTLLLLAIATTAQGVELGWTDVTVRLYHDGALAEADETRATATAAAILATADVSLHWAHCHAGAPSDARCARPLEPGEFVLRLTRVERPAPRVALLSLGEALVTARGGTPALATVHLDRVDGLARFSGADAIVLLGRAVAHELTHLLTTDSRHATTGLMRPVWLAAELAREHPADWTLDAASVSAVRARTAASMTLARR
jgi:hypothetical protein